MKKILTLLLVFVISDSIAQTTYDTTRYPTERIAYVTPNRDTIFVINELYPIFCTIWDEPYDKRKPILIPVTVLLKPKD